MIKRRAVYTIITCSSIMLWYLQEARFNHNLYWNLSKVWYNLCSVLNTANSLETLNRSLHSHCFEFTLISKMNFLSSEDWLPLRMEMYQVFMLFARCFQINNASVCWKPLTYFISSFPTLFQALHNPLQPISILLYT